VVLVLATRGELGEYEPAALGDLETIAERRVAEVHEAAKLLGVDRVEFLGYHDSGMAGEPTNAAPEAFAAADIEEAAARLAELLEEERADVLTIYDDHGGYGHPDHIQVHRVGTRAAQLAGTPRVLQSTMNRDHIRRLMQASADLIPDDNGPNIDDLNTFGSPETIITTIIDVRDFVDQKRAAMAAHASQITDNHFFLTMPPEAFREAFGYEWFIRPDAPPGTSETELFVGLD
jgi:LmbE family N-acetylglucosaminyl deacetylase